MLHVTTSRGLKLSLCPPQLLQPFSVSAKTHSSRRTVIAWGNNNDLQSQVPPALLNVTRVAAGALHSIALKSDSTVVCWGSNSFGQTNIPPNLTNVMAISAGATFSLALKSDGSLVQWGAW